MPVFMRKITNRGNSCASVPISALLVTLLGGCGMLGDGAASAFVSPGKFEYYNCDQLAEAGRTFSIRERELVGLTARAAQDPAGEFVAKVAYRTELMQARESLKQIIQLSGRKNCASQSKWQSDRALW